MTVSRVHRRITVSNFGKISRSLAEILQFFKFSRWPTPPSCVFEIAKFHWLLGSRGSRRISMPNIVKIGQSVAKILRFFLFSRWRPPPSSIFEIVNFYLLSVSGGLDALLYQISSKSVIPLWRYCDFSNFQDGRHRHLGFLKSRNFIGYWVPDGGVASVCQISSKSVNQL